MVVEQRIPTIPITEIEQSAFCQTDDELRAKTLEDEFSAGVRWQKLPVSYMRMSPEELDERIAEARAKLGDSAVILGHHYQRDEVISTPITGVIRLTCRSTQPLRRTPRTLSSAASTSWQRPRTSSAPLPEGHTAQLDGRLFHGGHGAHRRCPGLLGRLAGRTGR